MKCPRCGSGRTQGQRLGHLKRYVCAECSHTWADQIGPTPPYRQVHPDELPERRDR